MTESGTKPMSVTDANKTEVPGTESGAPAGQHAMLPIRDIAQRTGVNPVTLRAWERRYGLLVPARTGKGHRLYSEADVQRVREIQAWLARGVPIGKVRPLLERGDDGERTAGEQGDTWARSVQETIDVALRFQPAALQQHLEQLLSAYPPALLLDCWLAPLHRDLSRRTRFGSSVLRSYFWEQLNGQLALMLRSGQRNLSGQAGSGRLLLVSFPGAEQQAFAALFGAGLLAAGIDILHLGPVDEMPELPYAVEKLQARGVICFSHNALPMAAFGSGAERALRNMRAPVWFAGGIVELQKRDLVRLAEAGRGRLLPASGAQAIEELREDLS
ncbi:MerR family transcriptional regulator [Microbulbifer sp. JSM ZJ756]|uniref:MerR family transcriptional regulator n=1 Tax=Microbulbifer sp. JSM ZJ756 TaxID=3376191 RepID=UPI00379199BC